MSFKIGDKVKVVNDFKTWFREEWYERKDSILTIVADTVGDYSVNEFDDTIMLDAVLDYPADFELVEQRGFKVGDKIICVDAEDTNWYMNGDIHIVRGVPFIPRGGDELVVHVEEHTQNTVWVVCKQFELVEDDDQSIESHNFEDDEQGWKLSKNGGFKMNQPFIVDGEEVYVPGAHIANYSIDPSNFELNNLGVARPILETRKVGKVQQHMVEDGFPNALRELAKVLTWAADAKQYKLHDWKNLPDPEIAFPSAGYRHKVDNSIQKAAGLNALERVDHESNLLHLAHEVFNKLAELELILTGVIK